MLHTSLAVIFDMDGVILDTEPIAMRAWMSAAAETGFALTELHCHEMIGLGARESMDYIRAFVAGTGDIDRLTETANAMYRSSIERDAALCCRVANRLPISICSRRARSGSPPPSAWSSRIPAPG